MLRGIIFDCDGTLVDSLAGMVPFYSRLFSQCGLPPLDANDPGVITACTSLADADLLSLFIPDPEQRAAVEAHLAALSHDDLTADLALMPGALEVLTTLRPRFALAVATNRYGDMAAVTRRFAFDRYVDVVVTAADVDRPKPAPDMLLLAARRLGLEPSELLFVGDTDVDGEAATAAGMAFVLYRPIGCDERPRDPRASLGAPEAGGRVGVAPGAGGRGCVADLADLVALVGSGRRLPLPPR